MSPTPPTQSRVRSLRCGLRCGAFATLLSALGVVGCQARVTDSTTTTPDPRRLVAVELEVLGASDLDDDAHAVLKDQVRDALDAALPADEPLSLGGTPPDRASKVDGKLRFEVITDPEKASLNVVLHVTVDLQGEDTHGEYRLIGESWAALEPDKGEAQEALRGRAARVACAEAARQLLRQARVVVASDAELETLLGAEDTLQLGHAIHEVSRRRATKLAGAVQGMLFHPDKDVVIAALAALGELGSPDSVTAISDLTTSPDIDKVEHAIYALASIGGDKASALLEALATRHPEGEVRRLAQEQLQRLRARQHP